MANTDRGNMTVQEAGQKGGRAVADKYDHEHFSEIGQKGGQQVKNLINKGKQSE